MPRAFIRLALAAGWLVLFAAPAWAQNAQGLYESGQYDAAIQAGETAGDGAGLEAAAHAAIALAVLAETPCEACLKRAERLARHGIMADAKNARAHVYLAIALGYQARLAGIIAARLAGYPEQVKHELDAAFALAPDDAAVLAALGAWNIEVVRAGGSFLGNLVYGATFSAGTDYFRRAMAADPASPVIRYEYALTLSAHDLEAHRTEIAARLDEAAHMMARTAYERALQMRAAALVAALVGSREAYRALVARYQGYR